jgi:hypothetical protein
MPVIDDQNSIRFANPEQFSQKSGLIRNGKENIGGSDQVGKMIR